MSNFQNEKKAGGHHRFLFGGTLIEWYDFYIFGSLATIIATKFFPAGNQTLAFTFHLQHLQQVL